MAPRVGSAYIFKSFVNHQSTANPNWGDIFECCFELKVQRFEILFSLKRGKRDVRALSFELSKMTPQVGLTVLISVSWTVFCQ